MPPLKSICGSGIDQNIWPMSKPPPAVGHSERLLQPHVPTLAGHSPLWVYGLCNNFKQREKRIHWRQ